MQKITQFLDEWILFSFSNKLKFAIKVGLSMVIAFMVSFYMGWPQSSTAAITIMLIVSAGGVSDSVKLGILRVIGTVIGAAIGLFLIGLFPQERFIYLSIVSLFGLAIVYLYNAYEGDKTVFLLTLMMIMMVFKGGEVDDSFLYGVDRTYMTLFGIIVYGVVGLFLWPSREKNSIKDDATELAKTQLEYFKSFDNDLLKKVFETEEKVQKTYLKFKESSFDTIFVEKAWDNLSYNYKALNRTLNHFSTHISNKEDLDYRDFIVGYEQILDEIKDMLKSQENSWNKEESKIYESLHVKLNEEQIKKLSL